MRALILGILAALLLPAVPASAHPTPFSYLDVRVNQATQKSISSLISSISRTT
jgi:hypothetical protein